MGMDEVNEILEKMKKIIEEKKKILDALEASGYLDVVGQVAEEMVTCLKNGNKIILAGNGGSAADAQHFAGEVVGRFMMERKALAAVSLCVDPSVMTCIGNDYGYDAVFERQLQGIGREGDVFIAISTSGNSKNLINAVSLAKKMNMKSVGFLGKNGGKLKDMCDYALVVPSDSTPRIQEIHTFTVHILCEFIERKIFG